jgi:hypothetical protein
MLKPPNANRLFMAARWDMIRCEFKVQSSKFALNVLFDSTMPWRKAASPTPKGKFD